MSITVTGATQPTGQPPQSPPLPPPLTPVQQGDVASGRAATVDGHLFAIGDSSAPQTATWGDQPVGSAYRQTYDSVATRLGTADRTTIVAEIDRQLYGADTPSAAPVATATSSQEGVGSFFEGAIKGDYGDNRSWSATGGQVAIGFVPILGQIADARDTAAAIGQVWRGEDGGWTNLAAAGVAWIPGVGDAAKGAIRGGERLADAGAEVTQGAVRQTDEAATVAASLSRPTISEQRAQHILYGDGTGGGHLHPGGPGKSAFPASWSADRVLDEVDRIASDPSIAAQVQRNGRTVKEATVDGISIRVVQEPASRGGGVVTAFPTNVPRNP